MLGALYAILAAATFGFNNASARRGVLTGTAIQGMAISVPIGVPMFLIAAILSGELTEFDKLSTNSIVLLSAAGFMHFVWGRYWNMRSLAAVGSNIAGPVQQFQLLLSLTLAIVMLGETLTPLKVLGIILVISGPSFVLHGRAATKRREARLRAQSSVGAAMVESVAPASGTAASAKPQFTPRLMEGYTFAFLSSIGFGTSPVLVAAGLRESGLSLLGGLVSYVAAMIVVAICLMLPRNIAQVRNISRESLPWFTLSAVAVWASQLFRYMALGIAPVTVVQPIQSLSLLFRMIFGFFINREHEALDRYVIGGIVLSFAGALALSISDEMVTQYVTLPAWLAPLTSWRWP
jgi:drug/metabolite transporter (DMT)-like permease